MVFVIIGVQTQTRTFHRCAAVNPRGQLFTIEECDADQVMNVYFAEIGYSALYNPDAIPTLQCPWRNCTRSFNDTAARSCNGRRICTIDQDVFIFLHDSPLCSLQGDANFIRINFTCVTGIIFSLICCTASFYVFSVLSTLFSNLDVLAMSSYQ